MWRNNLIKHLYIYFHNPGDYKLFKTWLTTFQLAVKALQESTESLDHEVCSVAPLVTEQLWVEKYAPNSFTELLSDEHTNREVNSFSINLTILSPLSISNYSFIPIFPLYTSVVLFKLTCLSLPCSGTSMDKTMGLLCFWVPYSGYKWWCFICFTSALFYNTKEFK